MSERILFKLPAQYVGRIAPEFERKYIVPLSFYFNEHVETGGFLKSVLENDLLETVQRADEYSRLSLSLLIDILIEAAPSMAWGSKEAVLFWLAEKPEFDEKRRIAAQAEAQNA